MDAEAHVRALGEGQVAAGSRRVELGAIGIGEHGRITAGGGQRDVDEIALGDGGAPELGGAVA